MKLKLGPLNIQLREKPQPLELGGTGTIIFAGNLVEEEYNTDLQGDKAITVFEKMRRSDGQVKAALLACELPLRAARWDIAPASDSSQDRDIAEFVRNNLFDDMTITWDDFLRHILLMLPFGFSVFEKVWELKQGRYKWRKLAPRLPKTIKRWYVDDEGGLESIEQWVYKGGSKKGSTFETVPIPVEKLLVFSLSREGSNFRGVSLLRAAYKHWYYKDQLYRIDGIAAERHGIGVAVFKLPATATTEGADSDLGKVNKIGESLHAHERSYVALPSSYDFELKGVSGQLHDIIRSIEHHDLQIVRSILAQFINLGSSEVGSYALSQDQSGFFLMALRAVGMNICDTVNRYAIKQLVDYNWEVDKYPKLVVSGLEQRDIGTYSKAITDFVNAGIILPDRQIEAELRQLLRLPPSKEASESKKFRLTDFRPARHPRGSEIHVAFKDINDKLNSSEEQFVEAAKKIQDKQIGRLTNDVVKHIEAGEVGKVVEVDVMFRDQMADALEGVLIGLMEYGQEQVREEMQRQRSIVRAAEPPIEPPEDVGQVRAFLKTRAKATSNVLGSKLRAAMAWEALRQIKEGKVDRAALNIVLTKLSDRELAATAKFSVSEAFNFGRQTEAKTQAASIERVIFSAILDEHNCPRCRDLDGREYAYPSAEWSMVAPPYKECEGQDRCRCVGVYVYKSERRAV